MCDFKKDKKCRICAIAFFISFGVSISLIVGGFFVPPLGVIDGSVLTAVGELIVFPTLILGFRALELGYDTKWTHGNTAIELTNDDNQRTL